MFLDDLRRFGLKIQIRNIRSVGLVPSMKTGGEYPREV